jgi:hypothetical protein
VCRHSRHFVVGVVAGVVGCGVNSDLWGEHFQRVADVIHLRHCVAPPPRIVIPRPIFTLAPSAAIFRAGIEELVEAAAVHVIQIKGVRGILQRILLLHPPLPSTPAIFPPSSSSSVLIIDVCETGAEACEHHIRSHIDGEVESVAAANIGVLFNVAVGDFIQRFPELDDVDLEKKNDVSLAKPSH